MSARQARRRRRRGRRACSPDRARPAASPAARPTSRRRDGDAPRWSRLRQGVELTDGRRRLPAQPLAAGADRAAADAGQQVRRHRRARRGDRAAARARDRHARRRGRRPRRDDRSSPARSARRRASSDRGGAAMSPIDASRRRRDERARRAASDVQRRRARRRRARRARAAVETGRQPRDVVPMRRSRERDHATRRDRRQPQSSRPAEATPASAIVETRGGARDGVPGRHEDVASVARGGAMDFAVDWVRSARPLIPGVVRGWWGAWIRPRPPYVILHGGWRGRIQSPQEAVVRDQRTGEVVQGQTEHKRQKRQTERRQSNGKNGNGDEQQKDERRAGRKGAGRASGRGECAVVRGERPGREARGPGPRSVEALRWLARVEVAGIEPLGLALGFGASARRIRTSRGCGDAGLVVRGV